MSCGRCIEKIEAIVLLQIFFFVLAPPVGAQRISFSSLPKEIIEERIRRAAGKNEERAHALRELFIEAGCEEPHLTGQTVKGSRTPNILCTLPGKESATIIVSAHFDKVDDSNGVVDNWSGASLLPSLFQSLRTTPRKFTFLFIGFSDEEKGLVGSKSYAKQLSKEDKTRIRALINIDSLGLSSSKVWASRADRLLLSALGRAAVAMNLPITGMNVEKVGDSDSRAFADKHIPVIDIHSITQETLPILHTPRDSLAAIHMDDYYSSYRLITAYLSLLDTVLEDNGTEGTSSSAQLEQIRQ